MFTVKNHVSSILMKLHVRSRTEAAAHPAPRPRTDITVCVSVCAFGAHPPNERAIPLGYRPLLRTWRSFRRPVAGAGQVYGRAPSRPSVAPEDRMTADLAQRQPRTSARRVRPRRRSARDWKLVTGRGLVVLVLAWILFFAHGTSAGAAIDEPGEFVVTLLDGITFAGLMFVVASGFTLIFGLMRTVNMAHGVAVPAGRLHRDRRCSSDGRQDPQHRTGRRQHAVVGRAPARRRRWSPPSSASSSSRCSCAGTRARISARP